MDEMLLNAQEISAIINAVRARLEWIRDDECAPQEEEKHLEECLRKLELFEIKVKEEKT